VSVRSWQRFLLGGLLLAAVAVAGIALNFTLLGLTRDENEPVGKLSPRAVFTGGTRTAPVPVTTTTTPGSDDSSAPGDDTTPQSDTTPKGGDGDSDD
jgi:hypothetical protein